MNWVELTTLLQSPVAFHRVFATVARGALPGLFLSQAFYWSQRTTDPGGWFYKTQEEWHTETGMTRREQETARSHLREVGVLEEKKQGAPCRLYFRLNREKLLALVTAAARGKVPQTAHAEAPDRGARNVPTGLLEKAIPVCTERADKPARPAQAITETTPEITNRDYAETTHTPRAHARDPDPEVSPPEVTAGSRPRVCVSASGSKFSKPELRRYGDEFGLGVGWVTKARRTGDWDDDVEEYLRDPEEFKRKAAKQNARSTDGNRTGGGAAVGRSSPVTFVTGTTYGRI